MDKDENLVRYVQFQALQRTQTILFVALAEVLGEMDHQTRGWFLKRLSEQIEESLQSNGEDYSAHAGLLGEMFRGLILAVNEQQPPPLEERSTL